MQYARGVDKNRARLDFLSELNADVLVLTETHDDLDLSSSHNAIHSAARYPTPGGRWTTIWTSLPVIERLSTADPSRCVAVRLDAGDGGGLIVYGTVLPWNGDAGPDSARPARGWDEFKRVVPHQGREWAALRERYPADTLVIAGDLNQDLGGRHYYGTNTCRALLIAALAEADVQCLTTSDRFGLDLSHPPIDHVCAGAGRGRSLSATVEGWNNVIDGNKLSDHGGTFADIVLTSSSPK